MATADMEVEILSASGTRLGRVVLSAGAATSVRQVKEQIHRTVQRAPAPERQCLRLEARGKALGDEERLAALGVASGGKLYLKDLGPQISWKTVFLLEYAGPLAVYAWAYWRPWLLYGSTDAAPSTVVTVAAVCWSVHYAKRLFETLFVHRFSHGTMPLRNLFKNCSYYWLFALYVAYHVNHPLYTPPCSSCFYVGLIGFALCELGNLSVHLALRNLRPPGTKIRRIPVPDGNPFNMMFNLVSCPNYTYEFGSWAFFTIMTKCAPAGIFAAAGLYQMTMWAIGKHRNYKKEFPNYPKGRKAILPLVL